MKVSLPRLALGIARLAVRPVPRPPAARARTASSPSPSAAATGGVPDHRLPPVHRPQATCQHEDPAVAGRPQGVFKVVATMEERTATTWRSFTNRRAQRHDMNAPNSFVEATRRRSTSYAPEQRVVPAAVYRRCTARLPPTPTTSHQAGSARLGSPARHARAGTFVIMLSRLGRQVGDPRRSSTRTPRGNLHFPDSRPRASGW